MRRPRHPHGEGRPHQHPALRGLRLAHPIKARKARRPEAAVKEGGTYEVQLTQPGKHGEAKGLYEGYVFIVPKGNVGQKVWARVNKLSGKMAFCELSMKPKDA